MVTVEDTGVEAAAAVGAQPPIAPAVTEDGTVVTQVFARYDYEGAQEGALSFTVGRFASFPLFFSQKGGCCLM